MLYGGSLLWHTGRFGIRSAFALRIISGTVILNFGVAERLRVFRYSFFHRWGHYSATSCGSAALRAFPAITSQNKKAIAFAFLHQRWLRIGAADEARTRYLHLGKVALYQMSYGRIFGAFYLAPIISDALKTSFKVGESLRFLGGDPDRARTDDPQRDRLVL